MQHRERQRERIEDNEELERQASFFSISIVNTENHKVNRLQNKNFQGTGKEQEDKQELWRTSVCHKQTLQNNLGISVMGLNKLDTSKFSCA